MQFRQDNCGSEEIYDYAGEAISNTGIWLQCISNFQILQQYSPCRVNATMLRPPVEATHLRPRPKLLTIHQ